jgi:sugar phosphate isomerase/epimerase
LPDGSAPRFSISQITTLTQAFDEDLRTYAEAAVDGIGIWEIKLPERDDGETAERVRDSGLETPTCVPAVPSILPLPLMPGPAHPEERVEALCASVHRLAAFEPAAVTCLTGPAKGPEGGRAREAVVTGLCTIADEAERASVRVGLEPINPFGGENWTIVNSIGEAVALLEEVGRPGLGVLFDVWHLWNSATLLEDIAEHGDRLVGVHVADWREPTRGWADRVLPGDGVADVPRILGALEQAGWPGPYDLEIFSDNGAFASAYEDSLWDAPGPELARRGRDAFLRAWEERPTP